jgi:thioredoxin reductase
MMDVVVVGGSYAGLSAALQLARARRRVLVIDGGAPRNRFASHAHGFLAQDGRPPQEISAEGRAQLMTYPTVEWLDGWAERAEGAPDAFVVHAVAAGGDRRTIEARRIVLATGVSDELPDVPGLQERWGRSVFHCPYCHGYELGRERIGVLGVSALSMHHALMLPDWGETTFFLNGAFEPDKEQLAQLAARGVKLERERVARLSGHADMELADGRVVPLVGLFTAARHRLTSPLAEQLGCAIEDGQLGPIIQTDVMKQTTAPGVLACGDTARPSGSVALAVGDGAMAGAATHRSLMFGA